MSSTEEITIIPALDVPLSAAADLIAVSTGSSFSELIIASILFLPATRFRSSLSPAAEEGDDDLVARSLISNGNEEEEEDPALFLLLSLSSLVVICGSFSIA